MTLARVRVHAHATRRTEQERGMAKDPDLKELVEEIEDIEDDTHDLNTRKAGVYKKAKAKGYDVRALKEVIADRRRSRRGDPMKVATHEATVQKYHALLD